MSNAGTATVLTPKQVAARFQVSAATIYRWINENRFGPVVRVGRTVRIPEPAVDRLLAGEVA